MGDYRVLIVDDDAEIRTLVRRMLEPEGFQIAEASNGEEALALATATPPNLILLDLMMPSMTGPQFLEATTAQPRLSEVPVIVITAFDDDAPHSERILGILHKPFNTAHLIAVVRAARRRFPETAQRPAL